MLLIYFQHDRSFAPAKDLISSRNITQAVQRDLYICSFRDIHWKVNHILSLVHPQLHSVLSDLRTALVNHPSCEKFLSIWASLFPGHSLICNRTTGEHIDKSGIRRGFEAILAHGEFSGGELFLKDLNVQISLLPGTLILLDGTSQRHRILPWSGPQRYSNALFVHRSVLAELNIPHVLPNVTVEEISARLSRKVDLPSTHAPSTPLPALSHRKKRRHSDAEGGRSRRICR